MTQSTDDLLALSDLQGSVIIDGKSSYSGVDIKAVLHVYDGGKLAQQRQQDMTQNISTLDNQLKTALSQQAQLQSSIGNNFTSQQATQLNALNTNIIRIENAMDALMDEHNRIGTTKPQYSTKVLAELQTLSISTHREKYPVRGMGATYPKGFVRANRTIAGSMIFTVFDRNVLYDFLESHPSDFDAHNPSTSAILDQIPPFDITVAFANELGQVSRMTIYGIEIVNEGQTMSIEDLLLENVVQYVARDYDPMRVVQSRKIDENNRLSATNNILKASSLLDDDDYKVFKQNLTPYDRFKTRNDPFT